MKAKKLSRPVVPVLVAIVAMVTLLLVMSVSPVSADSPLSSETCEVLQPDPTAGKDAYIKEDKPNENKGDGNDLKVKTENGKLNRALLQFDLSSLPAGATINPEGVSMFEPIGGSAPKYTGQNIINPLAAVCAGGMMLDTLGEFDAAAAVENSVMDVTANKLKHMGAGQMGYSTTEVGDLVAAGI